MVEKDFKTVIFAYLFLLIALFSSISLAVDGNLNNDTKVNFEDLRIMAENWLGGCTSPSWCNGADINTDNIVNMKDFALIAKNWDTDSSLVLLWEMNSADDFTVGDGTNGTVNGRVYVDNKATGETYAGMTATAGIIYDPTEKAIYMNGVNPCQIYGLEDASAIFTSNSQYTFSMWAKGDKSAVHGGGYSFYLFWDTTGDGYTDTKFKCDLSWKATSAASLTSPGGGWQSSAYHIWDADPAYADRYVDPETWNLYTFVWDADNQRIATYVNGILRGGPYASGTALPSGSAVTAFGFGDGYGSAGPGGWYRDFRIYNRALEPYEIAELSIVAQATSWNHSPTDGQVVAVTPDFNLKLKWSAGKYAKSHDLYFGTSYTDVENATHASPEYKGNLPKYITYYGLTDLAPYLTYYWRIDEISTGRIDTGQTLSFSVSDVWLYTFHNSKSDLDTDERICAYTIQGFANKNKARLFLDTKGGNQMVMPTVDAYWANYLQTNKGYRFGIIDNLRDLIQLAKASGFVSGLVLYDPYTLANAGEVMPALNIASTENRLPVTANMLAYTSKEFQNYGSAAVFEGMDTIDIRGSWTTHLAAQTDYVYNHMSGKPKNAVCKAHQNFSNFNDGFNFNSGLDYGISKGYFIMDMNPGVTSEKTLFNVVMDYLNKPAMVVGDWHNEGDDVMAASQKGNYDVLSMCSNLSFWAHVPANPANTWTRKQTTGKILDPDKYYVMIQASDGDSMGFEGALRPSGWAGHCVWLDPDRGTTKITWTCQPLSATLWPAITEYYVVTSTENDTFCTGPSGAGYCLPSQMPNLADFSAFMEPYLQLTGLQWVENWWGKSESMWNTMKTYAPSIKCFGHQGTPGGLNHWLDDGTPVAISEGDSLWHPNLKPTNPDDPYNISDPNNVVNHITAFAATKQPPYFITCYDSPVYALMYSKQCQMSLPANFEMVTVEDFIDLMDQMVHPKPWGTLLTYDDFESGFGNYADGGGDCGYYTGSDFSRLGTHAVYVRDNSDVASSIYHINGIDVQTPDYTQIKVTFWFYPTGTTTGESLLLQYFDGSTWQTVASYTNGINMKNDEFCRKTLYINESSYNFPLNMKLRFMSDASSNYDVFYIDCITVEAK